MGRTQSARRDAVSKWDMVGEVVGHGAVLLEGPLVQVGQQLGDGRLSSTRLKKRRLRRRARMQRCTGSTAASTLGFE